MRISIISTIRHNIGDDFVREGIISLLGGIVKVDNIELIHKHSPITAVYGREKIRSSRLSKRIDPFYRIFGAKNRISDADLLIQSGAPVYWCHPDGPHCSDNEWFGPLIRNRFLKDRHQRKFLNIAGGSCQRYHSDGSEVAGCAKCRSYIAEFYDVCDLTILRDSLAKKMLQIAGRDADVLPCTSIFARDRLNMSPARGDYIVVNFMENGGHYTFGQSIDTFRWRNNFKTLVQKLRTHGRVVAACHTANEKLLVESFMPNLETYIVPDEHVAFIEFYSAARFAVVNRVHAGFMMASFGKPVTVIGNDSRALMIKNLNLTPYYVEDITEDKIDEIIEELLRREHDYADEIEDIRVKARKSYVENISKVI